MTQLEKQKLRVLHQPSWRGTILVLVAGSIFYGNIIVIIYCLSQVLYWPMIALILVNAYLAHSLVIAFHEAAHRNLCPWWPLNEYLGRLIGLQAFISLTLYRELHLWHHAYLGTPRDEEFWPFTDPVNGIWKRRLAAFAELGFGLIYTPILYFRAYIRSGSRIRIPSSRRAMIWIEVLAPWIIWGGVAIVTIQFEVFRYFAIGYLIPAFIAGNIQSLRKYIEHLGLTGDNWATLTRAIRPTTLPGHWLSESILNEPYHDLHHRYPKIPCENLPATAEVGPPHDAAQPVFTSYQMALTDLLRTLADPKFGPEWQE